MNYRAYKFYARKNFTSDTTIVEDIRVKDPISSIVIGLETVNAATSMTAHPAACITKIEIVDGSEVLYSLDGYEAEALDWYNSRGKFRSNYNIALNGSTIGRYIGINFGRWLWDPALAFDPSKFTNPQIRVSLDIDAGGMTCASVYVTMWANLFDQKSISPIGMLMAKEYKKWTMAASTHEYTDLPLDYPYRAMYLRAFLAGTEPNQSVENIKISEDQDKRIPFDLGGQDLLRLQLEKYGICHEQWYFATGSSTKYIYCSPTERVTGHITTWAAAEGGVTHSVYDGDGGRLKTISSGSGANVNVDIFGYTPHSVYEIPCGEPDDPTDWWNVKSLGNLRADITGAASAAGHLFIQQLRPY